MSTGYILVFDHGTTGFRAGLLDAQGQWVAQGYQKVPGLYPQPGWVEQDPMALWELTQVVAQQALAAAQASWDDVVAIGLTNQRETTILWDCDTGKPVFNAIVWQCRRTAPWCEQLKAEGLAPWIQERTGLVVDPYFSATKIQWLLTHVPQAKALRTQGTLRFGTVDTWIVWCLSGHQAFVTDVTNASRTMLYNLHTHQWDPELMALFGVTPEMLPNIHPSSHVVGYTDPKWTGGRAIPIASMIGDQQAALYGQKCWEPGTAKVTFGTGAFLLMHLGQECRPSQKGLLTTVVADTQGQAAYGLEGAIFTAGATLEWLQNGLGIIQNGAEADTLARQLTGNDGVYLVPAFVGLGAPYWNANARAAIVGLTQGSSRAHLARAALEAMVYQTRDVLTLMEEEGGLALQQLRVDGGVSRSQFLMQFLADMLQRPVVRGSQTENTALGAGYLAGLATGFWETPAAIQHLPETLECFDPQMSLKEVQYLSHQWQTAVERVLYTPATISSSHILENVP